MKPRTKLAWKYFLAALLLFVAGYGAGWLGDHPIKLHKQTTKQAAASANPAAETDGQTKASVKPGREYTVKSGDTISSIAEANGLSFEQLAQYNNIPYPYNLSIGQVIVIPSQ